jgi:signal transduction histidine kinase
VARRAVPPSRLRRRLTIAFVLVAGVSAAALALGSYVMVRQARFDDSLQQADLAAREALVIAQDELQGKQLDADGMDSLRLVFERIGRHVLLVPAAAVPVSGSDSQAIPGARVRADAAAGRVAYQRNADPVSGQHLLVVGGRIPGSTDELYVVRVEDGIHRDLGQLRTALLAGWFLVVVVAALVGRVLARRTLEPVGRASAAARAVAEGLLATRLPVEGRDEFGAWALSFNRMADALEAKILALSQAHARERRFTADVAHELRTPVTALVAEASLLREHLHQMPAEARRPAQLLVGDVVRLRRLVEELMELSRLDAGQEEVSVRPVDIAAVAQAIIDTRGWHDRVEVIGGPVTVATDPRRLERVLANLVANAVEHGGRDVRVVISAEMTSVLVRVNDRGPGIPPEHLPRLFDRFYKADPARTGAGSGLGLAIARENARLLGADMQVWSKVGLGTEVRLMLPVTQRLPIGEAPVGQVGDREAQSTIEEGPS